MTSSILLRAPGGGGGGGGLSKGKADEYYYPSGIGVGTSGTVAILKDWFDASSSTLSVISMGWSGATEFYGFSSNTRGLYYPSALGHSNYQHSANTNLHRTIASGWQSINDGDTIAHGLSGVPKTAFVVPSGSNPFGISIKLDATNITVYSTAPTAEIVGWRAEI